MTFGMIANWSQDGFKTVSDYGLKYVEFCYNVGNDPEELKARLPEIKENVLKYGVKVGAIGRWGTNKYNEDGSLIEEELNGSFTMIDVCKELECPVFNTGVNYIEELSYLENCNKAVDFLKKLVDYGKEKGVKVATYNCDWNNFVREPKAWELVHGQLLELGIKYDPSHCINTGSGDYLGETVAWGERFYHFHIKGTINIGGKHIDDPPAGLDMVNWRPLIGLLYKKGYNGMLSIEPHSSIWKGALGVWGVRYTIDYISKMIYEG